MHDHAASHQSGQFEIHSDPSLCHYAVVKVCGAILDSSLSNRTRVAVQLALHEAVMNAIVHGNRLQSNLPVRVAWHRDGFQVTVEVSDCGAGFSPHDVADPTRPANRIRPGGRGLAMIRHFVDEVSWNEHGNLIALQFRLQDQSADKPPFPESENPQEREFITTQN